MSEPLVSLVAELDLETGLSVGAAMTSAVDEPEDFELRLNSLDAAVMLSHGGCLLNLTALLEN